MRCLLLGLALLSTAFALQPSSSIRSVSKESVSRKMVALNIFGNNNKQKEAEERARIEAEQEALNAKWAKESQNELVLMTVFGVGTSLPVIYLLYLALTGDGGGGTGVY